MAIHVGTCSWTKKDLIESSEVYPRIARTAEVRLRYNCYGSYAVKNAMSTKIMLDQDRRLNEYSAKKPCGAAKGLSCLIKYHMVISIGGVILRDNILCLTSDFVIIVQSTIIIDISRGLRKETVLALYNLMLALWVGGIFMFTFLVTPIIFKSFGRDTASAIVDKLFPFYFPYILVVVILTFVFFLVSGLRIKARHKIILPLLIIGILIGLLLTLGLYPEIKKTKQEIASFEKSPPELPARKRFSTLHGISMALNIVLLVDGIALIVVDSIRKNGSRIHSGPADG